MDYPERNVSAGRIDKVTEHTLDSLKHAKDLTVP